MSEPIHLISLGAGVQSSTMALMAAAGEITPMPKAAIFADTQDEPASVYKWLDWLEGQLPFPVYRVTQGKLSESTLTMKVTKDGRRFSSTDIPFFTLNADGSKGKITSRGCTRDFKIIPLLREARHLAGKEAISDFRRTFAPELAQWREAKKAKRRCPSDVWRKIQDGAPVVQWIGISLDEVTRMKPSRDPWARSRWPLIELEMKRHDCLRWMAAKGFPTPPRSACTYCPFHNNHEWRRLKSSEPEEFAKAVAFERHLQEVKTRSDNFDATPFLHRSLVPLDEVDFSTDVERGQLEISLFQNECEGMCGV